MDVDDAAFLFHCFSSTTRAMFIFSGALMTISVGPDRDVIAALGTTRGVHSSNTVLLDALFQMNVARETVACTGRRRDGKFRVGLVESLGNGIDAGFSLLDQRCLKERVVGFLL